MKRALNTGRTKSSTSYKKPGNSLFFFFFNNFTPFQSIRVKMQMKKECIFILRLNAI